MTLKPKKHKQNNQKYEYVRNTACSKKSLIEMINIYYKIGWELADIMNIPLGICLTFKRPYEKKQTTV